MLFHDDFYVDSFTILITLLRIIVHNIIMLKPDEFFVQSWTNLILYNNKT